ncbi:dihydrodipicolinate synthase family protein [Methylobacterium sp. J-068]|uniref:dihydrodipicolinate synthase family protein n=1 Tax=Methylobacterium sp. J-068 TaxID=2836649 RepID=UPI001FB91197|nr:dihydrodipicolinate synthase family protein [Methylobacterium sp. J-068]MCJ2036026.1 dihydrodipicolinate synthase family protein [Methylobacterium sp. J-068]
MLTDTMPKGVSAFPITPCSAGGEVDGEALSRLLTRLLTPAVRSIGLLGSTGSYPYLTRAARRRALEVAVETVAGRAPILVGVGALRTDEAVGLARDARAIGAAAGLLAPVSYTPLTDDEIVEHFTVVARESGLPLCIYDNPTTTHVTIRPDLAARLARIPGIVAIKSPAPPAANVPGHLAALRDAVPDGFSVGFSGDWHATEALLAGGTVWYSVAAGLFPEPCGAIMRAVEAGDAAEARRLDAALDPLWALFRTYSSLRVIYAAATILDLCRPELPRPLLPLPDGARREVAEVLARLDLI